METLTKVLSAIGASMTELTLTAIYEEAEDGGYLGYVAELPGANTQRETLEEVRAKPPGPETFKFDR